MSYYNRHRKAILIWLVGISIGGGIGLLIKSILDNSYTTFLQDKTGLIIAVPVVLLMAALIPLGYFLAKKIEGGK